MRWMSVLLLLTLQLTGRGDERPVVLQRFEAGRQLPRTPIHHLSFSDDGKSLHSVGRQSGLARWHLETRKLTWGYRERASVTDGTFARDGSTALQVSYSRLLVFNTQDGKVRGFVDASDSVNAVALSPDNNVAATGSDNHAVELWDVNKFERLHLCRGHDGYVSSAVFDPSSKTLATGAHDRTIRLWDVKTGKELRVLTGHTDQVSALAFLPGGKKLVSASWDKTARLWDVETGKELKAFQGHRLSLMAVAVSGDGKKLATGCLDGLACLWDIDSGKRLQTIEASEAGVSAVALSADAKKLATGAYDDAIVVWDAVTGKRQTPIQVEEDRRDRPSSITPECVALSSDHRFIVTGSQDGGVRLFEVGKDKPRLLGRHHDNVWGVAFSPDGKHIASVGRRDGTVHIWDRAQGGEVKRLTGQKGGISKVIYARDGKRLIAAGGSFDPAIYVWDVPNSKVIHRLEGHKDFVRAIALSKDGKWLASSGDDNTARLWNLTTGKQVREFDSADAVRTLDFHPDGAILAGGDNLGTIYLWEVTTGKVRSRLGGNPGQVHVEFLRDGRTLVSAGSRLDLWELATETERLQTTWPEGELSAVAIDPSWRRFVSAHQTAHAILSDPVNWNGKPIRLEPKELDERWHQLAGDPFKAYSAILKLTTAPTQALPLFEKHLQPVPVAQPEQLTRWVEDLGSDKFRVRDQATRELEKVGDVAEPALRRGLKQGESLEKRRRIERLLDAITGSPSAEHLRRLRMIEVLENIGSVEARRLLEKVATGNPDARLSREAKATLRRLDER